MKNKFKITTEPTGRKKEFIKAMTDVECYPIISEEPIGLTEYTKMPLSNIITLGNSFQPLSLALQSVLNNNVLNDNNTSGELFRAVIPNGTHLAKSKNGAGNLGTLLSDSKNQIVGQAKFQSVSEQVNPTNLACTPAMLVMAVALANINEKLDNIQELQQDILDFLVQKERSDLKGDMNFLADTLNNYKYNWDNDNYKHSHHIKVLDIKQTAERKIGFYREQITSRINKKSFFHNDQEVKKQIEKIQSSFKDYQLSLYLYSFSSFLEIMLLENFDPAYLNGITSKIENYSHKYREIYTKCFDQLEGYSQSSIEANLLKGLASVNKFAGKTISKIPVIGKSQIDEKLIETGEKLGNFGVKRTTQTMEQFIERQSAYIRPFIDNINAVNRLYNQPLELLFDNENLYINTVG